MILNPSAFLKVFILNPSFDLLYTVRSCVFDDPQVYQTVKISIVAKVTILMISYQGFCWSPCRPIIPDPVSCLICAY